MNNALQALRSADFLTRRRIALWSAALLIGFGVALAFMALTAHGLNDYKGRPLGTDFSNSYAAGKFVLEGKPTAPFDVRQQFARERAIFGPATPFFAWHYPPFFLVVAGAVAGLPYIPALFAWNFVTLVLYLLAMAALLGGGRSRGIVQDRLWILPAAAFPAVFVNMIHGQNGFLTAALLAGGLAILDERPILAGMAFGLLVYKPQFLLVIPIALVASARWRVLLSAFATILLFSLLVTVLFGQQVWPAFMASTHFARTVMMENGGAGFYKSQSVFAWVRLWGGTIPLAYVLQGAVTALALAGTWLLWRSRASSADKGAFLCCAMLLATPYCLDYDLMILAPAIALLAAQGILHSFRRYEKILLAAVWFVPIAAREVAALTLVPLGVWTVLALACLIARNGLRNGGAQLPAIRWRTRHLADPA